VAIDATYVSLRVAIGEEFAPVVGMAHKAGCVLSCSLSDYRGYLLFGRLVEQQRLARIDNERRQPAGSFGFAFGRKSYTNVSRFRVTARGAA